jgi:hypothetical protein
VKNLRRTIGTQNLHRFSERSPDSLIFLATVGTK